MGHGHELFFSTKVEAFRRSLFLWTLLVFPVTQKHSVGELARFSVAPLFAQHLYLPSLVAEDLG